MKYSETNSGTQLLKVDLQFAVPDPIGVFTSKLMAEMTFFLIIKCLKPLVHIDSL